MERNVGGNKNILTEMAKFYLADNKNMLYLAGIKIGGQQK